MSGLALLILGIGIFAFLKRRRGLWKGEHAAPYVESQSTGVTAPALAGRHKTYRSLNTVMNQMQAPLPDQPVEAGLMSRSRYTSFPSDTSRRTLASS